MSLIFLAGDFPPSRGGIQTVAYELPLALHELGEEVGVVAVCQPGASEFDEACPYPVVRVPGGSKSQTTASMSQGARELAGQLGSVARAIIATKWFPDGLAARWAFAYPRLPLVLMAYGREFRLTGGNPVKWLAQRMVLGRADIAVACSRWTAGQLRQAGLPADRIHVVNPGIRPAAFASPKDVAGLRDRLGVGPGAVLLTTGRLVARKGHADVVGLLPRLGERVGPVTYVIVGGGPEEERLRSQVAALGLGERVVFAGGVAPEDLPDYYHLCDAFVMPTRDLPGDPLEGFGIVYLEANSAGKPVIATDCGGVADAVEDGVSGLLVPPGDPEALLEATARLLTERELASRLGELGRQRVAERFTWDKIAQQFLEAIA